MNLLDQDYWLPHNFAALPRQFSSFENSQAAILPIPYEQTTSYRSGTRQGPAAIISASQNLELYDQELGREIHQMGICTLPELIPDLSGYSQTVTQIKKVTTALIKQGKFPVALGGEHTISLGLVQAAVEAYPDLSVLQLDAHADLRDSYQDTPYSHACVMRRILDYAPAVQVGTRSLSQEEADFAKAKDLPIYYARDLQRDKGWIEKVITGLKDKVYITIDLDVFDPSLVPAVGTPEPGGLGWYTILELLRWLAKEKEIVGFDVVELCPLPNQPASDFLAAKLIYKLLGYVFS